MFKKDVIMAQMRCHGAVHSLLEEHTPLAFDCLGGRLHPHHPQAPHRSPSHPRSGSSRRDHPILNANTALHAGQLGGHVCRVKQCVQLPKDKRGQIDFYAISQETEY